MDLPFVLSQSNVQDMGNIKVLMRVDVENKDMFAKQHMQRNDP